ncbi:MAG: sensor histidine kinase [Bacteroidota bacterium]
MLNPFKSVSVYALRQRWKAGLLLFALFIAAATLWYTESLAANLRRREAREVERWAMAVEHIVHSADEVDLSLATEIIEDNESIPLLLVDDFGTVVSSRNVTWNDSTAADTAAWIARMADYAPPIEIELVPGMSQFIYQYESTTLRQLRTYPRVLLGVMALFLSLSYYGFHRARRAEEDQVWTGMARETAHQLGTPLSALYGWLTVLEDEAAGQPNVLPLLAEVRKDLERLQTVADRFSKIGSDQPGTVADLAPLVEHSVSYLQKRLPKGVDLRYEVVPSLPPVRYQPVLLGWVLENLIRNAVDALHDQKGRIEVRAHRLGDQVILDVTDNGKGMTAKVRRSVFRPGFTTKKRGWGLGLSLARRIAEQGHGGSLQVLHSTPGQGTTFRLALPLP